MTRFKQGDIVTNGATFGDKKTPYNYTVVCEHGGMVWVIARNGNFAGEYLTFYEDKLFAVRIDQ